MNHPCSACGSFETSFLYENPAFNKFEYKKYKCYKCGKVFIHDVVMSFEKPKTEYQTVGTSDNE
jgi:hypothetical protein